MIELNEIFSESGLTYLFKNNNAGDLCQRIEEVLFNQQNEVKEEKAIHQLEALGFYGQVQAPKIKSVISKTLELNSNYAHTSI